MEFSARDGGWSAYRWGSFQRLMDVIYGRAAVDTLKTCVSKQQGSFGLVLDCEKQGFQKALNKWGAGWNLVGHLLMQSDTFESPRPQSCWEYESCHLFRTLLFVGSSLSSPFFFLLFTFGRQQTGSLPVSCFLSDVFPQAGMQEACQIGRPEPLAREASLTQNFTITQAFSPSPLNRAFGKNHFMPPPSQWCSEAETSCRIPAGSQPGYGRVNWVIHAQQRMWFLAGLESGEHTDGACPGLMKWVG